MFLSLKLTQLSPMCINFKATVYLEKYMFCNWSIEVPGLPQIKTKLSHWFKASTSNTEILERFQSKAMRMIVDAPWLVTNTSIRRDLQIPTVKEEILRYSSQYSARLSVHPNDVVENLMD
jgi:hypothetical protein